MIRDEIDPDKTIGYGNIFSDGMYFGDYVSINHVD